MASKAYVASMTVAELTSELKKRGLSCRGKKKTLQSRLEEALENEELSESSSDDGREATIRAASAVISQLEGDGTVNNYNMTTDTGLGEGGNTEGMEGLVVSIEHSRRLPAQTDSTTNGNGSELLESCGKGSSNPVGEHEEEVPMDSDNHVPRVQQILTTTPNPTIEQQESNKPSVIEEPKSLAPPEQATPDPSTEQVESTASIQPRPDVIVQPRPLVSPTPDMQPKQDTNAGYESTATVQDKQDSNASPTPDTPSSIQQQTLISPTKPESSSSQKSSPSSVSQFVPLSSLAHPIAVGTTPDKSGFLVPTILSPRETDAESEANSIAVEPPSPHRDDVSFMGGDEGNTSISSSVELMDMTPSDDPQQSFITQDTAPNEGTETSKEETTEEMVTEGDVSKTMPTSEMAEPPVPTSSTAPLQSDEAGTMDVADDNGDSSKVREDTMEDDQVVVSSQAGIDSGPPIEVDVLVPIVEDEDMSVFSAEADEVQNRDNKASQRPSTLLVESSDDVVNAPADSMRSLSSSDNTTGKVGGALVDSTDNNGSKKRTISIPEESRDERERSGTPTMKRRRISTSPKRVQERRRKWGSGSSRTPIAAPTAISSDILENIIPDEVKEEVTENTISALGDIVTCDDSTANNNGDTVAVEEGVEEEEGKKEEPSKSEEKQLEMAVETEGDETKQVEEEDILDLGKESSMVDEYEQEWKEKEREREEQRKESQKAKQELETRRRIEARVRAKQQQEKVEEKEKPVVRRTPSPARHAPSRMLYIVNLTRPFTNNQLRDLLQDGSDVLVEGGCWTDRIKSRCIAVFLTMESAIAARNRIHNLKWPRQNPRLLKADYLTPKEVFEYSNGELEIQPPSPDEEDQETMEVEKEEVTSKETKEPLQTQQQQQQPPSSSRTTDSKRRRSSTQENSQTEANHKQRLPSVNEKEEAKETEYKPKSMLDSLFRKTQATPPIYWLPLSEKEANDKEAERKAEEAEREKRREDRRKEREMEDMAREKRLREEREERAKERMRRRRDRSRSHSRRRSSSPRGRRSRSRSPRGRDRRSPIRRRYSTRSRSPPPRRRRSTRSRS